MKIEQVHTLLNSVLKETLGQEAIQVEDLQNVVELGKAYEDIINSDAYDKYCGKLINRIGRTIFVDRVYEGQAPSVLMEGWEYGSIMQKIQGDLPDSTENPSWNLKDGQSYDPNVFHAPKVSAKFFNAMDTYQIAMSFTRLQVKQSFTNATQLNAFFSMIENRIKMRKTIDYDNLIMRTINNFTAATLYHSFNSKDEAVYAAGSKVKAINLLYLYKLANPETTITVETCLYDLGFLKFATKLMGQTSDRLAKASTLFNISGKTRFTPKDRQHFVLLSDFEKAAASYLQADTFHDEFVKLPKHETVVYWQGSGTDYAFGSTSDIDVNIKDVFNAQPVAGGIEVHTAGILGVIFDHDALGVCNKDDRVTSNYNPLAEFTNFWYKSDAEYFNDYDENFVVFFVAE
uniref:Major capsid protein n=1 Tax=Podoviridae sp. cty7j44 TaxID=2826593 RepID=A0A8S5QZ53_9CAUD|nr:MAG TPA: major capsid protein [Podoviridae sp. cty7j44]